MTSLELVQSPADQLPGDVVGVFHFTDQRPLAGPSAVLDWRLDGQLTRDLLDGRLHGRTGEHAIYQNNGRLAAAWALCVGGGRWAVVEQAAYAALIRHLLEVVRQAGFEEPALCLPMTDDLTAEQLTELVRRELVDRQHPFTMCRLSTVDGLTL